MKKIKTYRVNRFARVEGNNSIGWAVINIVTGFQAGPRWPSFKEAKEVAAFLYTFYTTREQ